MIHYWEDGHNELYNLNTDSFEQFDLSSRHPEKTLALYDELSTWLVEVDSKFPIKDPDYDPNFNRARKKKVKNNKTNQSPLRKTKQSTHQIYNAKSPW